MHGACPLSYLLKGNYLMNIIPEATYRNQRSTARHSLPWTAWKVGYDASTRKVSGTGKRVRRG